MSGEIIYKKPTSQIGRLIIDQSAKRNALTAEMWAQIPRVLDKAAADKSLRVLIVSGAGDHFAAGADISEFETLYATAESSAKISAHISAAMEALAEFPRPTIAEIRGACVGGGCGLALACDIRLANGTAKFAITPGKLGLVYPFSDIRRLASAVGTSAAKDILFSARVLRAEEAYHLGLVTQLIESGRLKEDALEYAQSIADCSGQSALVTKQMFALLDAGQKTETAQTKKAFLDGFSSADFKEGYRAFLEKRTPDFDTD